MLQNETENQDFFKTTLEQTIEGLQILDHQGVYLYVNNAAAVHGHTTKEALIGKRMLDCYPGIESTDFFKIKKAVLADRVPRTMENFFTYPDGKTCWFELFIEPHDHGVLIRSIDITQKKRLQEQQLHSQKIESVGLLAGGVAHDFNNKLGVMTLFCEMAEKQLKLSQENEKIREYLTHISTALNDCAALTRQLLAFGRKQVFDLKIICMNELLIDKSLSIRQLMGEGISVRFHHEDNLGHIRVDPSQMDQVIINLCMNAREAINRTGHLTIETANIFLDEAYCKAHPNTIPGEYVMLSISDSGHGMTPEVKTKIFEPFFSTKQTGKGSGLGLASVHGIVNQSRGHIWVYSEPNIGTTFRIYFPKVSEEKDILNPEVFEKPHVNGNETILLIEDEPLLRKAFQQTLESVGYEVHVAENGNEAQDLFLKHKSKISLLLTDLILPKTTGAKLAHEFLKLNPNLKVIYVSGYTENSVAHHEILDTPSVLLQKPVTTNMLLFTVRQVLDGHALKGIF